MSVQEVSELTLRILAVLKTHEDVAVEQRFGGNIQVWLEELGDTHSTKASVRRVLRQLRRAGYVREDTFLNREVVRHCYTLTAEGNELLRHNIGVWQDRQDCLRRTIDTLTQQLAAGGTHDR